MADGSRDFLIAVREASGRRERNGFRQVQADYCFEIGRWIPAAHPISVKTFHVGPGASLSRFEAGIDEGEAFDPDPGIGGEQR